MTTTYGKIWGCTSAIFSKNNVEIHRIKGVKGGRSSTHKHTAKFSMFWVEAGSVKISIEKNEYKLIDSTTLKQAESTIIKPGEYHYFEILENNTICYEIYWVEIDPDDISRRDCGSCSTAP